MNGTSVLDPVQASTPTGGSALISYDDCSLYNTHRQPVGISFMANRLRAAAKRLHRPVEELRVSALCCGTGQNEAALLGELANDGQALEQITCIDGSKGMLSSVAQNLESFNTEVNSHHLDVLVDELPIERQDAIECIQAIQHFQDSRMNQEFECLQKFYRRVRDKLVRGGEFFQIVSVPHQVLHSYWFYNLMSNQSDIAPEQDPAYHFANEHPPLERVLSALESSRFSVEKWKIIRRPHFRKESYYSDPGIVMNQEFRHCSSIFWIMKRRELIELYDEIARKRLSDGSLLAHRAKVERARKEIGISIAISAKAR